MQEESPGRNKFQKDRIRILQEWLISLNVQNQGLRKGRMEGQKGTQAI